ncbi:MAG TPA: TniQ family protein [Gallionella sp.]|nr:TniQ family protein [Gallionella sp.]
MTYRSDVLYGLSGTLWPIHLKPLPDELLSSWIVRLAHAHRYKVQTMSSLLFGRDVTIWNRDVDRVAPAKIGEVLVHATGASVDQFESSTLRGYEGTLMERHTITGVCRWVVPLGIFHRARKRSGLMFCPQCLDQDTQPYFRRRWRLALSTVCSEHECYLLDACPRCQAPLAPHRVDMQGRQVYPCGDLNVHCWKCGFDLRDSQQTNRPSELHVQFQAQLDAVLQNGYANWAGNPSMHSLVFFEGLRSLIAGITSRHTQERLKGTTKWSSVDLSTWPCAELEMASLPMRRKLFNWLASLLESWPVNFVTLIRENKLRYADLKGDSDHRSYWYEDVIRREASGGHAPISHMEAEAIAGAVEARLGRFSGTAARILSGRDIVNHVVDRLPQPISDEVYEDLLTSIDHQIAGTLDKIKRAALIRDKVMFAAGRLFGLSEAELAGLTLEQVRALVLERESPNFSDVAKTQAQARAWIEWYWKNIRPFLQPRNCTRNIFTSYRTRKGLGHSSIGAMFQQTVNRAFLQRSIRSYSCWRSTTSWQWLHKENHLPS